MDLHIHQPIVILSARILTPFYIKLIQTIQTYCQHPLNDQVSENGWPWVIEALPRFFKSASRVAKARPVTILTSGLRYLT